MYNKIFTKILDSSIWLAPDPHRIVWIAFLAAMDEDGHAMFASVANVASRARVSLDDARSAIAAFEGPDPDSGDPENEGRRIERFPGGWHVLNAHKYRAMVTKTIIREQTRLRVEKHRKKTASNAPVTQGNAHAGTSNASVTPSVALALAELKNISTPDGVSPRKRGSSGVEGFDLFWVAYPRKTAKSQALKAFSKLAPSVDQLDDMLQAISTQRTGKQWLDGFIPHPATWINGSRWEDEQLPVGALIPEITVPGLAAVAQTSALLAEMAEAGRRSQSPEAQAARIAAMARMRGAAI